MSNRTALIILLFLIAVQCLGQKVSPELVRKLNAKADSISKSIDSKYKNYSTKIDSTNKAAYIVSLEKANSIQSGNNSFYQWVLGVIGVIVTFVAIFIAFNFRSAQKDFKRNITSQKAEFVRSIDDQQEKFKKIFESNNVKLNEVIESQQKQLQSVIVENKRVMEDLVKNAEDRLKTIEAKSNGSQEEEIAKLKSDIKRLNNFSSSSKIASAIANVSGQKLTKLKKCSNCGELFDPVENRLTGAGIKDLEHYVVCPVCSTVQIFSY